MLISDSVRNSAAHDAADDDADDGSRVSDKLNQRSFCNKHLQQDTATFDITCSKQDSI